VFLAFTQISLLPSQNDLLKVESLVKFESLFALFIPIPIALGSALNPLPPTSPEDPLGTEEVVCAYANKQN